MAEHKIQIGLDGKQEKLLVLKDFTRRLGVLHEVQVENLKMWPLVILNAKVGTECIFDFENRMVSYKLSGIDGRRPKRFAERLKYLDLCVKFLLGNDYRVIIELASKVIYDGEPSESLVSTMEIL